MNVESIVEAGFEPAAAAVAEGRIPGAVLGVVTRDGARAVKLAGHSALEPVPVALSRDAWFDLASLTKVIHTTTQVLELVEAGRIGLDDPLSGHIPDFFQYDLSAPLRQLSPRMLLTHQAGLPAVVPIYTRVSDPQTARAYLLQNDWPLGQAVYSDIGFLLLGILIERCRGVALGETAVGEGLSFAPDPAKSVATERCTWRGRVMRGEVHDENAYAFGGAAGHAGLFGQIDGVLGFAHDLMAGAVLGPDMMAEITKRQTPTRGLGWQLKWDGEVAGEPAWAGGSRCSANTLGHTGFTGTGLWLDLERGVAWALLTNRVHPSRHVETGIGALRVAVGDIVGGENAGGV